MSALERLIAKCIERKIGSSDFSLFYTARLEVPWEALIGSNRDEGGLLGAYGMTALEAVQELFNLLVEQNHHQHISRTPRRTH